MAELKDVDLEQPVAGNVEAGDQVFEGNVIVGVPAEELDPKKVNATVSDPLKITGDGKTYQRFCLCALSVTILLLIFVAGVVMGVLALSSGNASSTDEASQKPAAVQAMVQGLLTLSVDNAPRFIASPQADGAVAAGVAAVLDDITAQMVVVRTKENLQWKEAMEGGEEGKQAPSNLESAGTNRRLATALVEVHYEITVDSDERASDVSSKLNGMDASTFSQAFLPAVQKMGIESVLAIHSSKSWVRSSPRDENGKGKGGKKSGSPVCADNSKPVCPDGSEPDKSSPSSRTSIMQTSVMQQRFSPVR
eukprot:TRINITY_DN3434_c0_g1_i3.p1 TRINITY_DN3434_c0_g1~~TRINITY_DN3434_c0_g1_i3.p1  ORF type:complete len:316 (+),score=59.93 TRINITY_DN3434_c0_g1_i3:28-948(+)